MSGKRIFFYVQHLLGIGHLRRAVTLARGLAAAGFEVVVVSGGRPIPGHELGGARLLQLPPVAATDMSFKELIDEAGRPVDEAWKSMRRQALLQAFRELRPDLLLFELFPFGRWGMRFELLPLLEAAGTAAPRPLIVSSVRDILVAKTKAARYDQMVDLAEANFDRVLVHGDPTLISFYDTLPQARRIDGRIHYTGYVVDAGGRRGKPGDDGWDEVVVSAGGGRVGQRLLETAIAARPLTSLSAAVWRVLVGYHASDGDLLALRRQAGDGVVVERARSDFPSLLMNCRLSISQGGYNTVMEALRAGCRAVVSPYAGGEESEQTLRCQLLAERGALELVAEATLTPARLAAAVERAQARPAATGPVVQTGGAETSARLLAGWLAEA
jgi:predicted glycosyltransferase